ncbi:hypothetical protein [Streptomyces smyrnaeus]|uniref:hypothetical protein n=1 Tax=Streptomyces smyrnaeus TaxID=1387713 RepID=UPI00367EC863
MSSTPYKVTKISGEEVHEGDELLVDHNHHVTFVGVDCPPWEDEETGESMPGRVRVRYAWGSVEEIDESRAGVFVDEV